MVDEEVGDYDTSDSKIRRVCSLIMGNNLKGAATINISTISDGYALQHRRYLNYFPGKVTLI